MYVTLAAPKMNLFSKFIFVKEGADFCSEQIKTFVFQHGGFFIF